MKPITINWKEWRKGESTSDEMADGGFSPLSYGLNLLKTKGLMYFIESPTDRTGEVLTGNIIAYAYDKNYLGNDLYFIDDEGAFYTLAGTTLTKRQTFAGTWTYGTTDAVQFRGNLYATSTTAIFAANGGDLTNAGSGNWWDGLTANYRHPLEIVEDTMYIGDVNLIHAYNGTTTTSAAITLPTDVNITSLRKHPDGRHLIAFCGLTANYSHTNGNHGRVYIIDTNTKKWTQEIVVEAQVEGSRLVGGIVYCTWGNMVGYFDGGLKPLKPLLYSTYVYSHGLGNIEEKLLVTDGINVRCFGNLGAGNVWWNIFQNNDNANNVFCPAYKGDNKMCFTYGTGGTGKLVEVDYDNGGLNGRFYTNHFDFDSMSKINRFEALHKASGAGVTNKFILYQIDDKETTTIYYDSNPTTGAGTWHYYRTENKSVEASRPQFYMDMSNGGLGMKYLRFWYASTER